MRPGVEGTLPFALKGVDTDNGGEFLNWHLHGHFAGREVKIEQTRSRPCHKNDQAHIEQKIYTHVRALLGYDRIGHVEVVASLDRLLAYWSLWNNLFSPTMRQIQRRREKSGKVVRRHEREPKTPFRRGLEKGNGIETAARFEKWCEAMDPFDAKKKIESWLKEIWTLVPRLSRTQNEGGDTAAVVAASLHPPQPKTHPKRCPCQRSKLPQPRQASGVFYL